MEDIRLCEMWSALWTLGPEPPMDGALGAIACGAAAAMVGGAIIAGGAIAAGLLVLCLVLAVLPTDADPSTRPS